ncbi:MAG: transketolase [Candidatus Marinimicrobia bacterium]|jgi:transketolase|nr:transketolase [Candidatus Neomarinimicrobiota bacterium]|tara:strand:- start:418 stop:1254 length:837 start_codon:yes stop_codon:yes gene_type:complete
MLEEESKQARIYSLISIYEAESGHPGGVLSSIDLIMYLFGKEMEYDPLDMGAENRDRFILSKGHCAPALYSVAAICGIIDTNRLNGLRKLNHELQGHTSRTTTPWVEASTGSLAQGFSFAIGEAFGFKMQSIPNRVYVMLGDGEIQEGQVWEGAMLSAHHKLNNLCAIIDYNKMQSDDLNENIMGLEPLSDKWSSFGWNVINIDGHDFKQIGKAFDDAKKFDDGPTVIIANTIKGKGVSYMEGSPTWHGSLKLTDEDMTVALQELGLDGAKIKEVLNG